MQDQDKMTLAEYLNSTLEETRHLRMGDVILTDKDVEINKLRTNAMNQTYYRVRIKQLPQFEYITGKALCEKGKLFIMDEDENPKRPTVFGYIGQQIK